MKKLSYKISLDTPIQIELTLKELINIGASMNLASPEAIRKHIKNKYTTVSEDLIDSIIVYSSANEITHYMSHKLSIEIDNIINEIGYKFEGE